MRIYKEQYTGKDGGRRLTSKWYIKFRNHNNVMSKLCAYGDRRASESFARKVERLVVCRSSGDELDCETLKWIESLDSKTLEKLVGLDLVDTRRAAAGKLLVEHVKDFEQGLLAKGNTQEYALQVSHRVQRIVDECHFRFWSDISANKVIVYLDGRRKSKEKLSIQTSNYYLAAFKQFSTWMVLEGRATASPVVHLKGGNANTDRRRIRHAFSKEEIQKILAAARKGAVVLGLSGEDREMLYRLAMETGLRWSELRSLTKACFDFDSTPQTVTVQAAYSKHRREDTLPLRPNTAEMLKTYLGTKLPGAKAFPMPKLEKGAEVLRADLEAAEVPYVDEAGRYGDFHALRHSFITNLAKGNVHPSTAKTLARHSDIRLTMNRYTHTNVEQQVDALEKLPDLSKRSEEERPATEKKSG